jgi:predicted MFS family arabinose efflux permease
MFVHWLGISIFGVGMTPLMKALGLSDSLILAVNVGNGVAMAVAFVWIAPRIKSDNIRLISRVVITRSFLVLTWVVLPIFLSHPVSFVFVFSLVNSIVFHAFYALIWLPITTFAISQAPPDRKGVVQGQLMSVLGISNAIGSILGGLVITAYGYPVGFVAASIIALLALPIFSRINIIESS